MILTYHHIGGRKDENWVSVESFTRQMSEINNRKIVHFSDYDPDDPNQTVITFDDGGADIEMALPILKKYGYPFEIFIVGDWFGTEGHIGEGDAKKIVAANGHLQWHTKTHRRLTELSEAEIEEELSVPPELQKMDPDGFFVLAYPYWCYNETVQRIALKKFYFARSGGGHVANGSGSFALDSVKVTEQTSLGDTIVKYIDFVIPTLSCNLRCHYCYITQRDAEARREEGETFQYSPEQIADALSIRRLDGIAIINFCAAGETLIVPQNLEYIKAILGAGHFSMVVSNMTPTRAVNDLLGLPAEWRERLFFKASLHWLELKRLNLLETFTNNVNNAWKAGVSITVEVTPSDELEPEIPKIKAYCLKHFGALPHITIPRDEDSGYKILTQRTPEEFKKIWGQFDSDLFDFKMAIWDRKVHEFCYSGEWGYTINIATGEVSPCWCYPIGNLFACGKEGEQGLPRSPIASTCPFPYCYNGHFWKTFGMVPDIKTPTFADMRDRIRTDGTHWLYPRVMKAFQSKATDNNRRYSKIKEWLLCRTARRKRRHPI